ncbi:MAG: hypothetical protein HN732_12005 [Rhodospirillaceae bacterium]|nr:hypothetical protein [Rhodospirillaceae bacterium]
MGYLKLMFALVLVCLIAFAPIAKESNATVILNIDGDGQLLGAQNVDVGGVLYNVSFVENSCIAIFDGCDTIADFDFQTASDATEAAEALLEQVLLDSVDGLFDSEPSLVNGITGSFSSHLMIPFALTDIRAFFRSAFNSNGSDVVGNGSFSVINNTNIDPTAVWVDFSLAPVGEPGAALLLATALAGLFVRRWRYRERREAPT